MADLRRVLAVGHDGSDSEGTACEDEEPKGKTEAPGTTNTPYAKAKSPKPEKPRKIKKAKKLLNSLIRKIRNSTMALEVSFPESVMEWTMSSPKGKGKDQMSDDIPEDVEFWFMQKFPPDVIIEGNGDDESSLSKGLQDEDCVFEDSEHQIATDLNVPRCESISSTCMQNFLASDKWDAISAITELSDDE